MASEFWDDTDAQNLESKEQIVKDNEITDAVCKVLDDLLQVKDDDLDEEVTGHHNDNGLCMDEELKGKWTSLDNGFKVPEGLLLKYVFDFEYINFASRQVVKSVQL